MIAAGTRLGPYEILSQLGSGGMGEVYRAKDTRLNRTVALKVLPTEKLADPERKRRFVQEARAASALNHPNIVTIYDINSDNGTDFIAMEYVAGKTLDQIIPRKGLRLNEALKYAIQITDALAKAHGAGIVHRDLKPANVMVSEEGVVKVLDFGLAKLVEPGESDREVDATITKQTGPPKTEEGTILGTVAYMSPEQAEGKRVDARSDIFSFGSVLYEIVTGQRAFQGDSKMSTLAAILNKDPKRVTELSESIPAELERIITRCLRKAPERRWQNMADLKVSLEDLKEESDSGKLPTPAVPQRARRLGVWVVGLITLFVVVGLVRWLSRPSSSPPSEPSMIAVPLTSYPGREWQPTFSPDGNQVAFSWDGDKQDNFDIYVKLIGAGKDLRLTNHPAKDYSPAWSPDGRQIAFLRDLLGGKSAVFLTPAIGGSEHKLAEIITPPVSPSAALAPPYLSWSPDGRSVVITDKDSPDKPFSLYLLSIETNDKQRLTFPPDTLYLGGDSGPSFSPDGRTLAFSRSGDVSDLYLLALAEGLKPLGEPKRLTFTNRNTTYPVWTANGQEIIFSSGYNSSNLWRMGSSGSGQPQRLASVGEGGYDLAISHRGNRLAYSRRIFDINIWRLEVAGPNAKTAVPTMFISTTQIDRSPQFSPDGKKIAFVSDRSGVGEIWVCDSDGSNAMKVTSFGGPDVTTPRWSPDGERITFDSTAEGQYDIYTIHANGGKPHRLTTDPANDGNPSWSHDGHWIYFDSNRTREAQVWKIPADGGAQTQVTRKGGFAPLESPDGKFLYYTKALAVTSVWKVPVGGGEETQVLESLGDYASMAVVQDGIYFIPTRGAAETSSIQFFNFASGKTKIIATFEKPEGGGLTVSPDGRCILYTQLDQSGSDVMLVENFH